MLAEVQAADTVLLACDSCQLAQLTCFAIVSQSVGQSGILQARTFD